MLVDPGDVQRDWYIRPWLYYSNVKRIAKGINLRVRFMVRVRVGTGVEFVTLYSFSRLISRHSGKWPQKRPGRNAPPHTHEVQRLTL